MTDLLCPHILAGTAVPLGNPPWGKVVNPSVAYICELAVNYPRTTWVVRFERDDPRLDNPEQAARDWFARRLPEMKAMRAALGDRLVFELPPNEPPTSLLPLVVRFYHALVPMCYGQGFRVAVGNPSVGEWHQDAWGQFASVLRILRPGSYLSVHEYWRNEADLEDRWLTARWTQPQIAAAIGDTEILVTECGRDAISERGGPWRTTTWADQYLLELWRYEDLLRAFPRVKAAFVYTLGTENDAKWRHYEVGPIWGCVVAMYGQPEPEPPLVEPLPQDETATDAPTLAEKSRWWLEEEQRAREAGRDARADDIRAGLIELLYRLERALKGER